MIVDKTTPFFVIYERFLSKITDDLYLELTKEETYADLQTILINAISGFEFPRFPIFNYQLVDDLTINGEGYFNSILTHEEIDIISDLMMIEWLSRQIASVENTRMKYSGSDFKFTSQANHLDKLLKTQQSFITRDRHKQRLYKRRKINPTTGEITPNYGGLAGGASTRGN